MRPTGATREATRKRLMDAAVELFAQRGFAATGIRELAAAAGLTSSSLYEYMATKDDLLVEIMAGTIQPLITASRSVRDRDRSPEWTLATLTEHHVWLHASHPHRTMVTDTEVRSLSGERRQTVIAMRDEYEAQWRATVADGVAADVFDVVDPAVTARSLISLCTGIGGWYRPGGRLSIQRLCVTHADLVLAAVRATRDGRPIRCDDLDLTDPALTVAPLI